MSLDPQAEGLLAALAEGGAPPLHEMTVAEARAAAWGYQALAGPGEEVGSVVDRYIPGPHADLHVRIYRPADVATPAPAVVYFHGSGWVIANVDVSDTSMRRFTNQSGCVVVSVNYQKAPEHPFPIPLDDCSAAARWVVEQAEELGVDPERVAVMGDSAGGNLAAAVCLRARDEGGPSIAAQVLVYPVTDCSFDTASYEENATGYLLERDGMKWFWGHYLADPADAADPLASPLRATDLTGLPAAFVLTAEFDPLRDEGDAYAARLAEAGVPVQHSRYAGQVHGFFWMPGVFDAATAAIDEMAAWVRQRLAA